MRETRTGLVQSVWEVFYIKKRFCSKTCGIDNILNLNDKKQQGKKQEQVLSRVRGRCGRFFLFYKEQALFKDLRHRQCFKI